MKVKKEEGEKEKSEKRRANTVKKAKKEEGEKKKRANVMVSRTGEQCRIGPNQSSL